MALPRPSGASGDEAVGDTIVARTATGGVRRPPRDRAWSAPRGRRVRAVEIAVLPVIGATRRHGGPPV